MATDAEQPARSPWSIAGFRAWRRHRQERAIARQEGRKLRDKMAEWNRRRSGPYGGDGGGAMWAASCGSDGGGGGGCGDGGGGCG